MPMQRNRGGRSLASGSPPHASRDGATGGRRECSWRVSREEGGLALSELCEFRRERIPWRSAPQWVPERQRVHVPYSESVTCGGGTPCGINQSPLDVFQTPTVRLPVFLDVASSKQVCDFVRLRLAGQAAKIQLRGHSGVVFNVDASNEPSASFPDCLPISSRGPIAASFIRHQRLAGSSRRLRRAARWGRNRTTALNTPRMLSRRLVSCFSRPRGESRSSPDADRGHTELLNNSSRPQSLRTVGRERSLARQMPRAAVAGWYTGRRHDRAGIATSRRSRSRRIDRRDKSSVFSAEQSRSGPMSSGSALVKTFAMTSSAQVGFTNAFGKPRIRTVGDPLGDRFLRQLRTSGVPSGSF